MVIHDVEQNTTAWENLHLGRPTASDFSKIITPVNGDLSKQAKAFAFYKTAEAILNESLGSISHLEWVTRGKALEPEAVQQFEFVNEVETMKVGFVTTDDGRFGCSPDRWIVKNGLPIGLLEVKCPAPQTHLAYWADGPEDTYRPQLFGQMLICEMEWVDFYSYHPRMPPVQRRITRDPAYMARLSKALRQFDDMLQDLQQRVRREGFFDARDRPATTVDKLAEDLAARDSTPPWDDGP